MGSGRAIRSVKGCTLLDLPQQSADLAGGGDGEAGQVDLDPIPGDLDAPVYVVAVSVAGVPDYLVVAHPLVQDGSQFCKDGRFMALGLLGETLALADLGVGLQVAGDEATLNVGGDVCDGPGTADGDPDAVFRARAEEMGIAPGDHEAGGVLAAIQFDV